MYPTIPQLTIVQANLLGSFSRNLLDTGHRFPLLFRLDNFAQQQLCRVRIPVQVIIQLLRHEIKNKITHRRPLRGYIFGTQLRLRLRLEHRFLYFYADRRDNRSTNIGQIKIFLVKITDRFHHGLPESNQVRTSLRRVLTVHERVILFPVLPPVCHCHLNIIPLQMNDRVQPLSTHILWQQVIQPSLGM